jgi:TolB-like protein/DNA-binding winged helix-turn-helix (wHTH) protein/Flp pilus assembly protein TadD
VNASASEPGFYAFCAFRLDPIQRVLVHAEAPVPLPGRLFDLLLYLLRNPGRVISRDELLAALWRGRHVDERNLDRAISSLRQVLRAAGEADTLIATVSGRGYSFGRPVTFVPANPPALAASPVAAPLAGDPPHATPDARRTRQPASGRLIATASLAALVLGLALHQIAATHRANPGNASPPFTPTPHSVAVLAFANTGANPSVDYVASGLTDELIDSLGRVPALHVAARTSSLYFSVRPAPIQDIARRLGVGAVLEGAVRQEGNQLRITAELVDGMTGFQIWTRHYDRAAGDILHMQEEIAEAVTSSLQGALAAPEVAQLTLGGTQDSQAFDAYLRGTNLMNAVDEAADRRAIAAFDEAIARDPHFAMAHARRARALMYVGLNGTFSDMTAGRALQAEARRAAEQAVALAPGLGIAHSTLGYILKCTLADMARAQAEFTRAIELAPNDAAVNLSYGFFQLDMGHIPAALTAMEKAAALDPLSASTYRMLAVAYAYSHRSADAATALRHAAQLESAPTEDDRIYGSLIAIMKGDNATARTICAGERDYHDQFCLAWADHALGQPAQADAHLQKLRALMGDNGAYSYAELYAGWGMKQQAVDWLRTAYRLRDPALLEMQTDPLLDAIRGDGGFQDVERQLGFVQ